MYNTCVFLQNTLPSWFKVTMFTPIQIFSWAVLICLFSEHWSAKLVPQLGQSNLAWSCVSLAVLLFCCKFCNWLYQHVTEDAFQSVGANLAPQMWKDTFHCADIQYGSSKEYSFQIFSTHFTTVNTNVLTNDSCMSLDKLNCSKLFATHITGGKHSWVGINLLLGIIAHCCFRYK